MTPPSVSSGWLRELAAQASGGPWFFNPVNHLVLSDEPDRVAFVDNAEDLALVALAPDLAALAADMADALETWLRAEPHWADHLIPVHCNCPRCESGRALLARFAALNTSQDTQ